MRLRRFGAHLFRGLRGGIIGSLRQVVEALLTSEESVTPEGVMHMAVLSAKLVQRDARMHPHHRPCWSMRWFTLEAGFVAATASAADGRKCAGMTCLVSCHVHSTKRLPVSGICMI